MGVIFLRLLSAVIITAFVGVFVFILGAILINLQGGKGYLAAALTIPITMALAPAVFVACLNSENTKKKRLKAAVKGGGVILFSYLIWSLVAGAYVASHFLSDFQQGLQYGAALHGVFAVIFMFGSGALTAHWLPSTQGIILDVPPKQIKKFEFLMFGYMTIMWINIIISYGAIREYVQKDTSGNVLSGAFGGPFIIAVFAVTFLIVLYMTLKISRHGNKNMRLVMFCFFILGVVDAVPTVSMWLSTQPIISVMMVCMVAIQAIALYFAYTKEANSWLDGMKRVSA